MADKKISELPAATSLAGADILPVIQGGANKKVTVANLFSKINTPVVINEQQADQDTRIAGDSDANLVFVDASTDRVGFGTATPTEKVDIVGGLKVSGLVKSPGTDTQTSSGVVDLTTQNTILAISSAAAVTLQDGSPGQEKILVSNNVGPVTLSAISPGGFSTITFAQNGATAVLKFVGGKWYVLSTRAASVA